MAKAYEVYSRLVLQSVIAQQRSLKQEILKNKNQLQVTSSQDQFAKWAKLRRKVDKGLVDLEKISKLANNGWSRYCQLTASLVDSSIQSHETRFKAVSDTVLSVSTSGAQWAIVWWFRQKPVFWMPAGWMPRAMEWIMSVGGGQRGDLQAGIDIMFRIADCNALTGAVSVTTWFILCKKVINVFSRARMDYYLNQC